jgi:hypothetical protein
LSVAAMDTRLALVRDRRAASTAQPISREFDEAGVKTRTALRRLLLKISPLRPIPWFSG